MSETAADLIRQRLRRASERYDHIAPPEPEALEPDEPWPPPTPLTQDFAAPAFPAHLLPLWLRRWVEAEARATQTPPDLAAMLALAGCAAGAAGKFRVQVRDGWSEGLNLFAVVSLPAGDRKSGVFADATAPIHDHEAAERQRMAPVIAQAESERRILEGRLKQAEAATAKEEGASKREILKTEAVRLAKELAALVVPPEPVLVVDDDTPESLSRELARQRGRLLQASDEGTAFEIAKGRYSQGANFDVYLKGHAGTPLKVGRVSRGRESIPRPALSVALAVQPSVVGGIMVETDMRGQGFLARFLYAMPRSLVGSRQVNPAPVPADVAANYRSTMIALWSLTGEVDEAGEYVPHVLRFALEADAVMQDLERWLEPQLAEGEPLSHLAGWASKLAGAVARLAAILHMAETAGVGGDWNNPVSAETVRAAVAVGKDYLLPHAQAAFGLMGADPQMETAKRVLQWIRKHCVHSVDCVRGGPSPRVSKRDIHAGNRALFDTADKIDIIIDILTKMDYLRPLLQNPQKGAGRKPSPLFEVNPLFLASAETGTPAHNTHNPQN